MAVPIFDGSIRSLQEPEKTAVPAIPGPMAPHFDGVARLDVLARDPDPVVQKLVERVETRWNQEPGSVTIG